MKLNTSRVWLGGIGGGVVWNVWSFLINMRQAPLYEFMQRQGLFLKQPRYAFFGGQWILLIFVLSILIAYLYAWSRATVGAGPKNGAQDWHDRWILRGFPEQLCAGDVVTGSAHHGDGVDGRVVGRGDAG